MESPKSSLNFSSSPTQNPGSIHLKTDVQVAYGIQFGHCLTRCKHKEVIFPMSRIHIQLKSESIKIAEATQVSRTCLGDATPYFDNWTMYHIRVQ
jgi:hypothetical protein